MDVGLLQVKGEISCSNKTSTPYTFVVQGGHGYVPFVVVIILSLLFFWSFSTNDFSTDFKHE